MSCFTTVDDTLAAVRLAQSLAKAMAVPLTLMYFRAVSSRGAREHTGHRVDS